MENRNRRKFIKQSLATAGGMAATLTGLGLPLSGRPVEEVIQTKKVFSHPTPTIRFSAIGLNHGHIYNLVETVIRGGGELVSFYAKEPELANAFSKRYPQAKGARSENEILEDRSIQLIVSASIPDERGPLSIKAMQHGKDVLVDKPGVVSLRQLEEIRKAQKETQRIYAILYGRLEERATVKAGELAKAGAIGKVIQTIGLAPHRLNVKSRPEWFFQRKRYGGILCDIGSHSSDQFLYFTNTTKAEIVSAQVGNVNHPGYPELEDFGDMTVRGNGGLGYIRVDWFTPEGLKTWGDGRLTILGTEGYMEIRKNIDIGGRDGGSHLFLVDKNETRYFDCSQGPLYYGDQFVKDIVDRTQIAMPQEHCFLATELALKAQQQAQRITLDK